MRGDPNPGMGQFVVEPEQPRRRRKSSHSSTKSSKPRPILREQSRGAPPIPVESFLQDYAPPTQAAWMHYGDNVQSPPVQPVRPQPPPGYRTYPASAPQHRPPYLSPYGQAHGFVSAQPLASYPSQSTIRLAPAAPQKPNDGPFREQWDRMDRMAAKSFTNLKDSAGKTVTKMTANYIERPTHLVAMKSMQTLCKGAALCDVISSKFDAVITSIDDEKFSGKEQDLIIYDDQPQPVRPPQSQQQSTTSPPVGGLKGANSSYVDPNLGEQKGSNHFSKVWLYSNSRLPPHLPPFKVYMPTYPLLCLAATYSERAYTPPGSKKAGELETHIPADWRSGTKAMVLKAVPVEDLNTIVFAIRGSQTFMDWAVNYNSAPSSPEKFLDDPDNLCHAGFLYVAKKMIKPVADRLRVLLQENPARSNCSLLITGHSAGGAVAALLYAHMMSTKINSELNYLTSFFKRVHCITFGAPPVSLRALKKPEDKRHRKSLFYSFINEGDPIPRADKNVLRSLLKLYTTPAPSVTTLGATMPGMSKVKLNQQPPPTAPASKTKSKIRLTRPSKCSLQTQSTVASTATAPAWPIPPCTLAPAGRLVVLRQIPGSRSEDDVEAVTVDEEVLKKVVYGDLLKHQMKVYKRRIDGVATRAVTVNGV
ncbi:hypothetical protein NX059_000296 [Plenodomus lindquistii]|nr:hypothetical protein NX059_000296 [Plenodomus lindquistii]